MIQFPIPVYYYDNAGDEWLNEDVTSVEIIQAIVGLKGIDRDAFLADLARECSLLGIEWPADPRAETTTIVRPKGEG